MRGREEEKEEDSEGTTFTKLSEEKTYSRRKKSLNIPEWHEEKLNMQKILQTILRSLGFILSAKRSP